MLRAWSTEFAGDDPVTLLITSGDTATELVAERLLSAMSEAGLANTTDEATLELQQGPVPQRVDAVYTRSPRRAAPTGLMRIDDSTLDAVRGLVHPSLLPGTELKVGRTSMLSEPPNIISRHPGGELRIGEYCLIAGGVRFILDDERGGVIAPAVSGSWGRFVTRTVDDRCAITIENDVWIGAGDGPPGRDGQHRGRHYGRCSGPHGRASLRCRGGKPGPRDRSPVQRRRV